MGARPHTRRSSRSAATCAPEAARVERDGVRRATRGRPRSSACAPRPSKGCGVAEARAHVRQVGAGDDDDAPGRDSTSARTPSRNAATRGVAVGILAAGLLRPEAREDRDDAKRSRCFEHVLQEDDLELERVLALVVELIGEGVEAVGARGEGVDALASSASTAPSGVSKALRQRANGSRIGACEVPKRTNVSASAGSRRRARAVRAPVPDGAAPRIDVRRHERDHRPVAVRRRRRRVAVGLREAASSM